MKKKSIKCVTKYASGYVNVGLVVLILYLTAINKITYEKTLHLTLTHKVYHVTDNVNSRSDL